MRCTSLRAMKGAEMGGKVRVKRKYEETRGGGEEVEVFVKGMEGENRKDGGRREEIRNNTDAGGHEERRRIEEDLATRKEKKAEKRVSK